MDIAEIARLLLRIAHATAAAVWLGGGVYYLVALRPQVRAAKADDVRAAGRAAQRAFGEWASVATLVLIATGAVMMFDRVADGQGTPIYALWLGVKIFAAVAAFVLAGTFARRRRLRATGSSPIIDRSSLVLALGAAAFVIGVALSAVYPTDIGQR